MLGFFVAVLPSSVPLQHKDEEQMAALQEWQREMEASLGLPERRASVGCGMYRTRDEEQMSVLQEWRREMEASCWC